MSYAASEDALEEARRDPRHTLVRADITDAAAMAQVFATHQPDAVMHLAAETHVDRSIDGPGPFVQTNVVGTFVLLEAARTYWAGLDPARKAAFRFHHVSTDEVFGALEPGRPAVHRDHALRPAQPVFGQQGRLRPPGARLVAHLRPADLRHQHHEQLRPLAIPGEADPAGHAERARGQDAPGLRRRLQPARLAVRRRPRRGARAGAGTRRSPAAPWPSAPSSRAATWQVVQSHLRRAGPHPAGPGGPPRAADPLRHRPARPRFPLRDRPLARRGRAGLARAARFRRAGC